jgi:hypothetical protein
VNWLGAILYVPYATLDLSSDTESNSVTGRLHAAYAQVGHRPLTFGVILFAIGLLVIVVSLLARKGVPMSSEAGSEIRPPADGSA